jgi:hypothetical protein
MFFEFGNIHNIELKNLQGLSYCKYILQLLAKFLIYFLINIFSNKHGICGKIFLFQNIFLQKNDNSQLEISLNGT